MIPAHYGDHYPDAEDGVVYFRVTTEQSWLVVGLSGNFIYILKGPESQIVGSLERSNDRLDEQTVQMIEMVAKRHCRPDILADWLDDYYTDNPTAVEIARLLRICEPAEEDRVPPS